MKYLLRGLTAFLLAVLLMVPTALPVLAADLRNGEVVTIGSGEVIDSDLYIAGTDIIINGTVNGDVFVVGQTITINGHVNGGISVAGQTITVGGEITGGARIAGQTINVGANIGRDLIVAGSSINIASTARIGADLILGCNSAQIDGRISGNILGAGTDITITGSVDKNVTLQVNKLVITSSANIQGNLTYTSSNTANIQSGAKIGGTTIHKLPPSTAPSLGSIVFGKVLGYLMIFVIGIIFIFTIPRKMTSLSGAIRSRPWQSLGWGALIFFATPIAVGIILITVIGIPLALIILALWGIALYLAQISVAIVIGRLLLARREEAPPKSLLVGALALGLLMLLLLRLIPVFGFIVTIFTIFFGLGSLVTSAVRIRAEKA